MKQITSASNPLIKDLLKLNKVKEAKELNKVLLEGQDLLDLAYEHHTLDLVLTCLDEEKYLGVETIYVPKFILEKLSSNKSTQDVIGVAHYEFKNKVEGRSLVYLDGVQDPGNVGTIIRTALAFSYDGVILSSDSASIYNTKVIQSSKGAIFSLPIYLNESLQDLKNDSYEIIVTALHNSVPYEDVKLNSKFVIVLGNEGQGVKKENIDLASYVVKIDMDNIDSLNVAIAGGILLNHYKKM
jgi:RNA methyltransferase, TrmH family